jgi:hypothetical protein
VSTTLTACPESAATQRLSGRSRWANLPFGTGQTLTNSSKTGRPLAVVRPLPFRLRTVGDVSTVSTRRIAAIDLISEIPVTCGLADLAFALLF